jgi:aminopeptidase N
VRAAVIVPLCVLAVLPAFVRNASGSLGSGQAAWRTEFTDLAVEIDPRLGRLRGDARLLMARLGPGPDGIPLELHAGLAVISVTDGEDRPMTFLRTSGTLSVDSGRRVRDRGKVEVRIRYEGLLSRRVPELGFFEARIGPDFAHAVVTVPWYPRLPEPARRSKGRISFRVPGSWTVAGVGRPAGEKIVPFGKQCDFEVPSPVGFGFAAAPFRALRRTVDGLETGVFLLGGSAEKAEFYLENCGRIVRFLKDFYGFFPYDGYAVVECPQEALGNAGGGGYEGLALFSPALMPAGFFNPHAFGHELGHLYWGNCVEGAEGPVIDEGLAQMSSLLYLEQAFGEAAFRNVLKNGAPELGLVHSARSYFQAVRSPAAPAASPLRFILRGEDLELGVQAKEKTDTLHMLANSKGCFVFAMLRDLIGPEPFRAGLRAAMARFAWRTLTLADLRREFEKASGRGLGWFFEQWFFRTGAPEFVVAFSAEARSAEWDVRVRIRQARDVYRVAAEVGFFKDGVRVMKPVEIKTGETELSFVLPFKPDAVRFDPDYKILRWTGEF